ncbi:hypothetical protein H5410_060646 [Solanum commersonii]|uniref:Uncharacterized protein n=1 Tax=Solanum commersonii TaxID=4109 RepID=A0A9J5W6P9_SOLCO|nr:hypothetical protein H5410_060646 [Solanum commersonii]
MRRKLPQDDACEWIDDKETQEDENNFFNYSPTHQPHNTSTYVAPQSGYTISTPTVVPSSKLPNIAWLFTSWSWSNIPSSSASHNSLNTSSGSIRLSNLHIESNGSSLILPPPKDSMHMLLTKAIETIF